MKIAVMAAGGVGGYLAARLGAAGSDVAVLARGRHLEAIRAGGLKLASTFGDASCKPRIATDDPAAIGPVDIVVFAVKLPDMEAAAKACKPLLGPDTAVIPFVNGVEAPDVLARILGERHAAIGCCYISTTIAEPGLIRESGGFARFLFGELNGKQSPRMEAFRAALKAANVETPAADDMRVELWRKFVFLGALAGMTAARRGTVGPMREDPQAFAVFRRALEEIAAVGRAKGVALPADVVDAHAKFVAGMGPGVRASQAVDLEAGRPLELEWLSGAVVRLGAEAGVDTPVHATLRAVLAPFAAGKKA